MADKSSMQMPPVPSSWRVKQRYTAETCPGKPCGAHCDHVEYAVNSRVELALDVELTEREKELVRYILTDALDEFMRHRNVDVQRAGIDTDCEYYANYGADAYVAKRYRWMSDAQKRSKANEVRQRCRVAAILNHAAFSVEVK